MCIDPETCGNIAHLEFGTVAGEVESRMDAPVFDVRAPPPIRPAEQPLWGPRRGERHEKPVIPSETPWREWWYKGLGQPTRFEREHADDIERVARTFSRFISMDLPGWSREEIVEQIGRGEHPVEVLNEHLANWHDHMEEALVKEGFTRDRPTDFHNMWNYAWFWAVAHFFYLPEAGHVAPSEYQPPREFLSPTREQEEEERLRRAAAAPDVPETRKWWYMGYGGTMSEKELKKRAEDLAWRDTRDSYWEGPSDGSDKSNWAMTVSKHRDSGLLDESNYEVISEDMRTRFPDDVEDVRFSHWAVGWVDHLFVRIHDANGEFTPAFDAIVDWEQQLSDYPVADEDHYSNLEYETAIHNIYSEGRAYVGTGIPEHWAYDVYGWLSDNNEKALYNEDDRGAYPSDAEIEEALQALGYI